MPVSEKTNFIVIEGDQDAGRGLHWGELWRHRELLFFFSWRDLVLRYKQTILGSLWALLHPLLSVGVFSVFFGQIARIPSDGIPYALFTFSGLLLWIYFANTVARCSSSLVGNAHLINKVYFPRILLPISSLFPGFFDFAVASTALFIGCLYYGFFPSLLGLVGLGFCLFGTSLLSLGVGMGLGAMNVRYRDVNNGISFLLQLWMFATPVVYPVSLIDPKYRWLSGLNPMTGYVEGVRSALFGSPLESTLLAMSVGATALSLFVGGLYFFRVEKTFADVV
jgi:lipopolysaccharide transport system permease protein